MEQETPPAAPRREAARGEARRLRGVIAAIVTPVDAAGLSDAGHFAARLCAGRRRHCPSFDVFPSSEAALLEARADVIAGWISATVNVNASLCGGRARGRRWAGIGHPVAIRKLFQIDQLGRAVARIPGLWH